ncbi:MAG: hypothetical protein HYW47_05195 [Deltaproteobacteria bacterium]|nr:hypothetical protein [Deltaproteobacteria bacterium]
MELKTPFFNVKWKIEIKRKSRIQSQDVSSLNLFSKDYPMAKKMIVYGGEKKMSFKNDIAIIPIHDFLTELPHILENKTP